MTLPSQTALEMAEAAAAWLGSLNDEQRATAHGVVPAHDGNADAERRRWFYTPTDHGGLTMHQQAPAQQRAAMKLVATGLSLAGYVTVATTMGLENVLDRMEGFVARFDRERGRDPGLYYLRVFGVPGGDEPWGWRFGAVGSRLRSVLRARRCLGRPARARGGLSPFFLPGLGAAFPLFPQFPT